MAENNHADTVISGDPADHNSFVSEFHLAKMDCSSEERLVRMKLDGIQPEVALEFDLPQRTLQVFHQGNIDDITQRLESLNLGAKLTETREVKPADLTTALASQAETDQKEASILKWLLVINGAMFFIELTVGWIAQSTGLIADSLDMFADAAVYGVALYAVGRATSLKLRAAHFAGWLQLILAVGVLSEVARRFMFGSEPASTLMMGFGLLALVANVACLVLISKSKDDGAHMKASYIFSANDVIANAGVILAGGLVAWTGSRLPDLVIGLVIGLVVLNGSRRILQLRS